MMNGKTRRGPIRAAALALAPVALLVLAAGPARPQSVVSTGESFAEVSLLPGRVEPGGARMAGLVVDLAPEWKTYWRSPGEAGVPPAFDWSRSRNLASAEVFWPRPHVFDSFGATALGYAKRVVFPVRLEPEDPARPMEVRLDLSLGVCREICVLEKTTVAADIDREAPETGAPLVAAAEATVPLPGAALGLTEADCRISGMGKDRSFEATLDFNRSVEDAMVVLEGPDLTWFRDIRTTPQAGTGRMRVEAQLSLLDERAWIGRSDIRITVLADDFAADVQGCTASHG